MLKFGREQFDTLARSAGERREAELHRRLEVDHPEGFGRLSGVEQQSRLMALQALCEALGFNHLRQGRRVYALLLAIDPQLEKLSDRLDFYVVLTDQIRCPEDRLRMLEDRFGQRAVARDLAE